MAKGDDIVRRKKNKANRKKLDKDHASKVSSRVAAVIAAKKRRKSGKRSMCQGMCFSLPTPEDPFNDRYNRKMDPKKPSKTFEKDKTNSLGKGHFDASKGKMDDVEHLEVTCEKVQNLNNGWKKALMPDNLKQIGYIDNLRIQIQVDEENDDHYNREQMLENSDCPSKFLILCLNAIESELRLSGSYRIEEKPPLFVNSWGVEFWKCYSVGKDILDLSGGSSVVEQIAWLASTAADTIARKEKEGLSFHSPFLLFLVPSQEKGTKVRSVCKPLKALGIHTVSLHPGASLEHQIQGLKSCEPEFLVSTPERLLELVSMKAIDISGVSFLVVDGIEAFCENSCIDAIKTIKRSISGNPLTLVFNDCSNSISISFLQSLLSEPVTRLSLGDSASSQSACILQTCEKKIKLV